DTSTWPSANRRLRAPETAPAGPRRGPAPTRTVRRCRTRSARSTARPRASTADVGTTADVVVVGAGPAGSAAATSLARAGRDVVVVDKATFPRDKCCGDGLTALALRLSERL